MISHGFDSPPTTNHPEKTPPEKNTNTPPKNLLEYAATQACFMILSKLAHYSSVFPALTVDVLE
jgi:hypothetical protein